MRESIGTTALLLLIAVFGCQRQSTLQTAPVTGKVTYQGKPVVQGTVVFTPEGSGHAATGDIQPDGTFQLTTSKKNDGAVPGKYKVAVQVFPAEGGAVPGMEFAGGKPPIPLKFMDAGTSGLTAEIKAGENTLDLALTD